MNSIDTRLEVNVFNIITYKLKVFISIIIKNNLKMYDDSPDLVEGEMTITTGGRKTATQPGQPDFNTLDEPIKETMVFYY